MPAEEQGHTHRNGAFAGEHADIRVQLLELRTECSRQASTIGVLGEAVGALRTGARALKAENAQLHTELARLRHRGVTENAQDDARSEDHIALDVNAPTAARAIATATLRGRVPASVLESARLLATELATNSLLHSGASADATLIVRVALTRAWVCIEVEDPGHDGVVAPRRPDPINGDGFGMQLVQALSERWGLERAPEGGTRVWARLALRQRPRSRIRIGRDH
jgi:anti-sigma regulatory factor (Ser/Thr protein kinase)